MLQPFPFFRRKGRPDGDSLAGYLTRRIMLGMLPLVLLGAWKAHLDLKKNMEERRRAAEGLAHDWVDNLDRSLSERTRALQVLAASPLMDEPRDWPRLYRQAQGYLEHCGSHVVLASLDRRMLLNTRVAFGEALPMLPVSKGRSSFAMALQTGRPAVSDLLAGPLAKQPLVTLAVPVLRQGRPVYGLLTTFEASRFQEQLRDVRLPEGWAMTFTDGTGAVIARHGSAGAADAAGRVSLKSGFSGWSVTVEITRPAWRRPILLAGLTLGLELLTAVLVGTLVGAISSRRIAAAVRSVAEEEDSPQPLSRIREIALARDRLAEAAAQRRASEEALRESEARFRGLFQGAPIAMGILDPDGRFLARNAAFEGLLAASAEDLPDLEAWWRLTFPDPARRAPAQAQWAAAAARAEATGEAVPMGEYRITRGDGLERLVQVSGAHIGRDFLGTFLDVTDEREAQQALRASRARLATIFEASPVGIVISRVQDGVITEANPAFLRLLGLEAGRVVGRTSLELGLWVDPDAQRAAMERLARERRLRSTEAELRTASGATVLVAWSTEPAEIGGERVLVNLIEDLSERRRSEEERRLLEAEVAHNQKLESLGALAGGVAHDMNNVLAALMAVMSTTLRAHPDDPAITGAMGLGLEAANRGRQLVKGLTDFSRKDIPDSRPVDLNRIVRHQADLLGHTTLQKVQLALDLEEALPEVLGDPGAITNALMNLCVNAVDAMPAGGRLELGTRLRPDGQIELTVKDSGMGMPPEVRARALEPFFTTKPTGRGTGLGLALVYGIMKAHKGSVELRSEPGRGTEVILSFPGIPEPLDQAAPDPAPPAPDQRPLRVLLVDDEALVRTATAGLFECLGHTVATAGGGQEALAALREGPAPDLVVLDLSMPGMDGEETLRRLRELKPGLPVLLASGFLDERSHRILEGHINVDVLSKPFTVSELILKLGRLDLGQG